MRFAYIDSQGNEVSIPSVDALALRIELGAIGPDTQLYDAQADRWGPAQTHEIFHTLSRDLGGTGGFVAPPPPMAPPPPEEPEPSPEPAPAPPPPPEARRPAEPPPHLRDEFFPTEQAAGEAKPEEEEGPAFDFSAPLTLEGDTGAQEEPPDLSFAPTPEPAAPSGGTGLDLDLTFAAPPRASAPPAAVEEPALDFSMPAEPPPKEEKLTENEEAPTFDFGAGLELAPEPFAPPEPSAAPSPPPMDFAAGSGAGAGMELEQPMSAFTPEAPPSWMEQQEAQTAPDDGAMDVTRKPAATEAPPPRRRAEEAEEAPAEPKERPQPRTRPSPPRRPRKRSFTPIILGVVGLAVVGGGGYFGFKLFQGRKGAPAAEQETPELPAVMIPTIPAELLPRMRDIGELALTDMITELRAQQAEFNIPAEPNRDWLAGVYLANASRFPDVQAFWEGFEAYVDRVRESDTRVFHERYQARLAEDSVAPDTAAILLERADSGFLATRADRFEVYALMDDLVNAALDLHDFLLTNEASIEYAPAAGGVSRDPVLEAVPNTKQLGEDMWDRVDRITAALDALGTLDKVTTERLTAVLFDRIRRASFQ